MNVFSGILLISFISYSIEIDISGNAKDVVEGAHGRFTVTFDLQQYPGACATEVDTVTGTADENDFEISATINSNPITYDSFMVNSLTTVTYSLSTIIDGDSLECLKLDFQCTTSVGLESGSITFNIAPSPGGNGDPHFSQFIQNRLTNETTRICYDVTAKRNDFLHIFSRPKYETELFGQLKDDYYMHKIILKFGHHLIKAEIYGIFFTSYDLRLKWDKIFYKDWFEYFGMQFKQTEGMFLVRRDENDELSIGIKRRKDNYGRYYLDVSVIGLSTDYTGMKGLLGRIGNNKLLIYPQVQESNDKTTVIVNGKRTFGYDQIRQGTKCTLLNVDDLLYPQKLKNYILSKIK